MLKNIRISMAMANLLLSGGLVANIILFFYEISIGNVRSDWIFPSHQSTSLLAIGCLLWFIVSDGGPQALAKTVGVSSQIKCWATWEVLQGILLRFWPSHFRESATVGFMILAALTGLVSLFVLTKTLYNPPTDMV